MSKWIAEFELEDGDTMPEHMDLHYKGAKIDFHCKPLEQEPKPMVEIDLYSVIKQKYIERDVLDKIRAEIKSKLDNINRLYNQDNQYDDGAIDSLQYALDIIDKYKAETENP